MADWITNSPEIARKLRAADAAYYAARKAAINLPMAQKVEAYRAARVLLERTYAEIGAALE